MRTFAIGFVGLVVSMGMVLLSAGSSGAAVTLTVRGTNQDGALLLPGTPLSPGDQVRLDITARSDGESTFGLGASATDYELSGFLAFDSGEAIDQIFSQVCLPGTGCFGGLDNSGIARAPLAETIFPANGRPLVRFINAISLSPTTQSGALDPGVSGVEGDPQARLVFDVVAFGLFFPQSSIHIGARQEFGDALIVGGGQFGTVETIWVVPEPGTALLLGLGLAGLTRRR